MNLFVENLECLSVLITALEEYKSTFEGILSALVQYGLIMPMVLNARPLCERRFLPKYPSFNTCINAHIG